MYHPGARGRKSAEDGSRDSPRQHWGNPEDNPWRPRTDPDRGQSTAGRLVHSIVEVRHQDEAGRTPRLRSESRAGGWACFPAPRDGTIVAAYPPSLWSQDHAQIGGFFLFPPR